MIKGDNNPAKRPEVRQKISESRMGNKNPMFGKKQSKETIAKRVAKYTGENHPYFGKKRSLESRKRMSEAHKGEKSANWRGGLSSINKQIRASLEYRLWREAVFKRDNYTCIWCKRKGIYLNADHIKPFALFPEVRFAIDNGRTLCVDCHKKTDTYGWKLLKITKQKQ
jgi:hypothetical protein